MIQAIPQEHNGTLYRSRTEARWAEFFALTETQFQYEPEGFQFGSDWYVPDFLLTSGDVYFEVKAKAPNDREMRVARALTEATKTPAIIAMGNPGPLVPLMWVDATGETGHCVLVSEYKHRGVWAAETADGGGWAVPLSTGLLNCSATGDVHPALTQAGKLQFRKAIDPAVVVGMVGQFESLRETLAQVIGRVKAVDRGNDSA